MENQQIEEISVFAVMLYTHMIGKRVYVRHFRSGKELPVIIGDGRIDFNFQETRYLKEEVKIKKVSARLCHLFIIAFYFT